MTQSVADRVIEDLKVRIPEPPTLADGNLPGLSLQSAYLDALDLVVRLRQALEAQKLLKNIYKMNKMEPPKPDKPPEPPQDLAAMAEILQTMMKQNNALVTRNQALVAILDRLHPGWQREAEWKLMIDGMFKK